MSDKLDPRVEKLARQWMSEEFGADARDEIKALWDSADWGELTDRFHMDLEFGTAGLRGVIGAGTNRMNQYIVRMTTQGLANYILGQELDSPSCAIAHDPRRKSDLFALETALVLAGNGIKAFLFPELRPTPELSFAVRYLQATAGVVITASHNPPEYNGYKVCWSDGGQIVPPHDDGIINEVRRIHSLSEVKRISREEAERRGLLVWLGPDVDEAFLAAVNKQVIQPDVIARMADRLSIVYTPLHGTGVTMVPRAFERMGLKRVEVLESQRTPDSEFPTVKSPNPEEKEALTLAIQRAEATGAHLVLGTDPDADRMGLAYRDAEGRFELLNGNQIGSLLCHYILSQRHARGALPEKPVVVKTIVTTELQHAIATSFGAEVVETLTGFKYIGEQIHLFEQEGRGRTYVFGGEESYGYLVGTHARDKDAVVSSQMIAEIAAWCMSRDMTLGDYLDEIYQAYGVYLEGAASLTLKGIEGAGRIAGLLKHFRDKTPSAISGSPVAGCWDLQTGERRDLNSGHIYRTHLPKANVLVFFLADGCRVTLRPSGTEPKVKLYFSAVRQVEEGGSVARAKEDAAGRLAALKKDFMLQVDEVLKG
jgi:phosphoglucomutase